MSNPVKYISKIEIKGLWGKFDVEWDLNSDVNILSGINGSGKSTILNCISSIISTDRGFNGNRDLFLLNIGYLIRYCKIYLTSENFISYETINNSNIPEEIARKKSWFSEHSGNVHSFRIPGGKFDVLSSSTMLPIDYPQVDIINTFDTELKSSEDITKLSDGNVKTELDWEIYHLQKKYIDYQLNVFKKTIDRIDKNYSNAELIKIQAIPARFLEIVDSLFKLTDKQIDKSVNEIAFLSGNKKISPYQLSSGEKQVLVILLTVLVQDNKNAILFLDEPEISLHFDWQKKLIQYIRELNPNVQIILATHSPAVIMEGWMDKVSNVSDLVKSELNVS